MRVVPESAHRGRRAGESWVLRELRGEGGSRGGDTMIALLVALLIAWSWVCLTAGRIYDAEIEVRGEQ